MAGGGNQGASDDGSPPESDRQRGPKSGPESGGGPRCSCQDLHVARTNLQQSVVCLQRPLVFGQWLSWVIFGFFIFNHNGHRCFLLLSPLTIYGLDVVSHLDRMIKIAKSKTKNIIMYLISIFLISL